MDTSLCNVTVTLKKQEKMKTSFFLNRIYFATRNICLTLLPKNAHGITQRPTLEMEKIGYSHCGEFYFMAMTTLGMIVYKTTGQLLLRYRFI